MAFRRLHQAFKHLRSTAKAESRSTRRRPDYRTAGCASYGMERLEDRMLLTTVSTTPDPVTGADRDTFEFRDDRNNVIRVKVTGRMTAELIGAQINRQNNAIRLVNLPGTYGDGTDVFGGLNPGDGNLPIGPLVIPGIFNPNVNAIAAAGPTTIYAVNTQANFIGTDPITGLPVQGTATQIVQLTLPVGNTGTVFGTVIGSIFVPNGTNNPQLPLNVTGADVAPNGDLFFTAVTSSGATSLFSVRPSVANVGTPADEVAQSLSFVGVTLPPGGGQGQQAPSIGSIAFVPGGQLFGILNGGGQGGGGGNSQLVEISPINGAIVATNNITIGGQGGGGGQANNITGLDVDASGNLIAIQSGQNANILSIQQNGNATTLGPLGITGGSSLTFIPGVTDPFTGAGGAFIGVDPSTDQVFFVSPADRLPAQSLFNVYITDSDETGTISMGYVRDFTAEPPDPFVMRPFEGDIGTFRATNAQNGQPLIAAAPGGTGRVFIGARTLDVNPNVDNENLIAFPEQPVPSDVDFGTLPADVTTLNAGVVVAEGNNVDKILIGGTVTGEVDIRGNIDVFYAGWIITGDATGTSETSSDQPGNFNVAGDIRHLISKGSIGTNDASLLRAPTYVTGFDLRVGGTLGELKAAGDGSGFVGNVQVNHLSPQQAPRFERNQREAEFHSLDIRLAFEQFNLAGDPSLFNDTFDTAEYLGSIASSELGRSEVARVNGVLQKINPLNDPNDYYAVALMAGQTITVHLESFGQVFSEGLDIDGDGDIDIINPGDESSGNEVVPAGESFLAVGVFDPDNRLIATDRNNNNILLTQNRRFSFKADRPGIYRFAIGALNDATFTGGGSNIGEEAYRLTLTGIGDIAAGGVVTRGNFFNLRGANGVDVFRGDLGAVKSYANIVSDDAGFTNDDLATFNVEVGNIRAIDAVSLGVEADDDGVAGGPTVDVPAGSVGLVRASGVGKTYREFTAAGVIPTRLNNPGSATLHFNRFNTRAIGGSYQLIDGPEATVTVDLIANGGIGVIRAGDMAGGGPSILTVNADKTPNGDGIIDLIESEGAFGTLPSGGPQITTNGGNVRYIRVTKGTVYRDEFFGGGAPDDQRVAPNTDFNVVDDSGSNLRFRAIGDVTTNPNFNPGDPSSTATEFLGPELSLLTYPIRGSGGSVVINIAVTPFNGQGGLDIASSGGATAEVGRVLISGSGAAVIPGRRLSAGVSQPDNFFGASSATGDNQSRATLTLATVGGEDDQGNPTPPEELALRIHGTARVDVLNVVVVNGGTLGNATSIINTTNDGELVNVTAQSIGILAANGNIGLSRSSTGTVVEGIEELVVGNDLDGEVRGVQATGASNVPVGSEGPNLQEKNGVTVSGGNIGAIRANKAIGNVAVQGSIGEITPNADGVDDPSIFEGIIGNITTYSWTAIDRVAGSGQILSVTIGEGIAPSGTGAGAEAGIFAYNRIGPISGKNADIRGDIVSNLAVPKPPVELLPGTDGGGGDPDGPTDPNAATAAELAIFSAQPTVGIERISLQDGSIINADIFVTSNRGDTAEFGVTTTSPDSGETTRNRNFNIGPTIISGNGGIIGAYYAASDIAKVTVRDSGFGVFSSIFDTNAEGTFQGIEAGGYGIRGTTLFGGARVENIVANGDGTSLSTAAINDRVRRSESAVSDKLLGFLDPFFGINPNALTDINVFLGTVTFNNDAQPIVTPELSGVTDTGVIDAFDARAGFSLGTISAYQIRGGSVLSFGNSIGTLTTRDIINGLEITTGTFKTFAPKGDVFDLDMTVTGKIKKIDIKGSLAGNSVIRTEGDGGQIGTVNVAGNLIGNVNSSRAIKAINIGGDFTGNISVNSGGTALKTLKVGGAFIAASLDITGNVGTITSAGSLGSLGDTLTVNGNVSKILVGGDLRSNVRVTGNLKTLQVKGSIVDGGIEDGLIVDVSNTLNSLVVGGDIQQGVQINAKAIKKQSVGGQNLGEFIIA